MLVAQPATGALPFTLARLTGETPVWQINAGGQYGNSGRNSLRGPFDRRWDMSVKKIFYPHGERYRLELRGDINNLLNHTVFDVPASSLGTAKTVGIISSTVVSGRVVRLGMHLDF